MMYEFETPEAIDVDVRLNRGVATLTAEERTTTSVEVLPFDATDASREAAENTQVELRGGTLFVEAPESGGGRLWRRGGSVRVVARVPLDGRISLKLASADAELLGRWRDATANSASGDLKVDEITGDLSANLASGDLQATRIGGDVKATSASGDIKVRSIGGDASLNTASGDVRVEDAGGSVTARSASGDLDLGQVRRGEVRVQTASGDVRVAVVPGTGVYLDVSTVSGDTRSDLAVGDAPPAGQGADVSVHARTVSGDVSIVRAAQKASA